MCFLFSSFDLLLLHYDQSLKTNPLAYHEHSYTQSFYTRDRTITSPNKRSSFHPRQSSPPNQNLFSPNFANNDPLPSNQYETNTTTPHIHTRNPTQQEVDIAVMGILNDSTGTLMSCAHKNHDCKIGVIIGKQHTSDNFSVSHTNFNLPTPLDQNTHSQTHICTLNQCPKRRQTSRMPNEHSQSVWIRVHGLKFRDVDRTECRKECGTTWMRDDVEMYLLWHPFDVYYCE